MRKDIVALGADNKTSFSILTHDGLYVSDPVDDISNPKNYRCFEAAARKYIRKEKIAPDIFACDLHPGYRSTVLARKLARENGNAGLIEVQHQFAHIVSCMYDNGIDEKVIGVAFDGTGYGTDGRSWGGEFLICDRAGFMREYHLEYVAQPGGDEASREGWRMNVAYLHKAYGSGFESVASPVVERHGERSVDIISQMIRKDGDSPVTSSVGRLFDAVASLTGLCDTSSFEAESALLLEKAVQKGCEDIYGFDISSCDISVSKMIRHIMTDVAHDVDRGIISAKFHNTVGEIVFKVCCRLREEVGIKKVVLSGGCFQNKYLLEYIERRFGGTGFELFKHREYSPTDLGICIGQAVAAANIMDLKGQI